LGRRCLQAQPYRIDIHAHRWGEVVRSSADYFRQIREAVDHDIAFDAHAKIFEPKLAAQLGNALAPMIRCFSRSPCARKTWRPGAISTARRIAFWRRGIALQPL
jgi:galactonate dehydratase